MLATRLGLQIRLALINRTEHASLMNWADPLLLNSHLVSQGSKVNGLLLQPPNGLLNAATIFKGRQQWHTLLSCITKHTNQMWDGNEKCVNIALIRNSAN